MNDIDRSDEYREVWPDVGDPQDDGDYTPVLAEKLLTRSALHNLPDPEPLIANVLDQGTIALLYGRWGTGKSFVALDWGCCVATARAWQGRRTEQRRVLYVAAEGAYGLKQRVQAWETAWHTSIGDDYLHILPNPVNLTNHSEVRNLYALVDWYGYGLVILDTLARCMVGADENSAKDCGVVVDVLQRIQQHTPNGRGVALGVHHTGKDGKTFRGSSAFEAGADTVYAVNLDGGVIELDREKRKDGPQLDSHRLKLDPVDGTRSAVVGVSRGGEQNDRAAKVLSHVLSTFPDGFYPSQLLSTLEDTGKTTFYKALSELAQRGQIVNSGTDKRPFYKVAA